MPIFFTWRHKLKKLFFILGIVMAFSFCSCVSSKVNNGSNNANLSHFAGDWQLIFAEKAGIAQSITNATIHIENPKGDKLNFEGFLGVNDFFGTCELEKDGEVDDERFSRTKKMGLPQTMAAENIIYEVFENISDAKIANEGGEKILIISSDDTNSSIKFKKINISNTKWNLSFIKDSEIVSTAFIHFADKNNIFANTGINNLQLTYNFNDKNGTLNFEAGPMTMMAGDEQSTIIEREFLNAIAECQKYQIKANNLLLFNQAGEHLLTFTKEELVK